MVLENSQFNQSIKGTNAQLRLAQAELKNASSSVGVFGRDSERLGSVQEALAKQVDLHSKKVDLYKKSIEETSTKMNDNIKERDKLGVSLEKANKKYDEAVKLYGKESEEAKKAKEEVDRLKEEYEKKEKAIESNAKQIQNYETNLNKAEAQMNKTQAELKKVNEELARNENKWIKASESLKKSSEKMKEVGGAAEAAGDKVLKLSAPMIGAGAASLKFATEFEDSVAKVSAIADEAEVPIDELRVGILKLSDDTGIASAEIANNVYDAISAGQKTGDAVNFVSRSTKLAKAGFAEAGDSLDILTTIMNAYKLESQEVGKVSDMLIATQNEGKVTVGELSSVMGKMIPTAVATNTNLTNVTAGYALLTKNGIKAAESTTYMNSMLNEMSKSGTKADKALKEMSGKSFSDLMKEGKNLSDVLNILNEYAKKNNLSLKDMFGSAEAGKAALVLATNSGEDFNEMLGKMEKSAGATDKAFDKVTNTTGERFKKSLNEMKNQSIRFGDAIAPLMDRASQGISKISDKLGQLDDKQIQNIVSLGKFVVGAGLALKIGGKATVGLGNIVGGLSKVTGWLGKSTLATKGVGTAVKGVGVATGGATKGVGALGLAAKASTLLLNPWTLAIAGVGVGAVALKKHLEKDAVPAVDLFADKTEKSVETVKGANGQLQTNVKETTIKISQATKEQLGAYMELDEQAQQSLQNLYVNSTTITQETADSMVNTYSQMGEQIKQGMDEKYNQQLDNMKIFFENSKNITKEEQQQMLESMNENNENQKNIIEQGTNQINEIWKRASDEKRDITKEEQQLINQIQENMRTSAVKTLSKSELEQKVIMERLKGHGKRISTEQASAIIKQAERQRKDSVKKANQQYEQTVRNIIKMRDENKTITADQADKMIKEAERQRKESIKKADDQKTQVVKKIKDMNRDVVDNVDTETGKVLTKWDKLKRWWDEWKPSKKWFSFGTKEEKPGKNWTGTNYWRGGLTYLHDRPGNSTNYELYDLPRGTRIYNHDASQDLVMKTAEQVATKVANSVLKNAQGGPNGVTVVQHIYSKTDSPAETQRLSRKEYQKFTFELGR